MLENPSGMFKLSGILGFWRRNRSALELRINNLGSVQGAEQVLKSVNLTVPPRRSAEYVRLFHPDPVRTARMFSPQNFRQFGVECTLCSLGHSCRFSTTPR